MEFGKKDDESRRWGIYLLPNLFTVSSLFLGFFAIVSAMHAEFQHSVIAIFVAMIMDTLDGRVARLTNTQTEFGAQLDSLSDMVSFGVAPALLAYSWSLGGEGNIGWLAAFIYAVGVALRLARFNAQPDGMDKHYFCGLPCPAAAGVLTALIWFCLEYNVVGQHIWWVVEFAAIILGLLQVSSLPYRSFKDINLKTSVPFISIIVIVFVLVFIAIDPPQVLLLVFGGFAISGPLTVCWQFIRRRFKK